MAPFVSPNPLLLTLDFADCLVRAQQAMASNFYRQADSPRYILGHGLELGFICMGIVASLILISGYYTANKRRAQRLADGELAGYTPEELSAKGDRAITFRYMF